MTRHDPTDLLDTVAITVTRRAAETLDACIDAMFGPAADTIDELAPTGRIKMRSAIILDAADAMNETLRGLG